MGYSIKIGPASIYWDDHTTSIIARPVHLKPTPEGTPIYQHNHLQISTAAWTLAMEALDLHSFMFEDPELWSEEELGPLHWEGQEFSALVQNYPGSAPINHLHIHYANRAIQAYKAAHPDHIAVPAPIGQEHNPKYDTNLCLGEWLLFWLRWSVQNCKQPVFTAE